MGPSRGIDFWGRLAARRAVEFTGCLSGPPIPPSASAPPVVCRWETATRTATQPTDPTPWRAPTAAPTPAKRGGRHVRWQTHRPCIVSELLRGAGEALYGACWQTELARDLQVSEHVIRQWVSGAGDFRGRSNSLWFNCAWSARSRSMGFWDGWSTWIRRCGLPETSERTPILGGVSTLASARPCGGRGCLPRRPANPFSGLVRSRRRRHVHRCAIRRLQRQVMGATCLLDGFGGSRINRGLHTCPKAKRRLAALWARRGSWPMSYQAGAQWLQSGIMWLTQNQKPSCYVKGV